MLCVADCVIWRVVPQPTEWQHIGNQIDAALIFTRADFVNVRHYTQSIESVTEVPPVVYRRYQDIPILESNVQTRSAGRSRTRRTRRTRGQATARWHTGIYATGLGARVKDYVATTHKRGRTPRPDTTNQDPRSVIPWTFVRVEKERVGFFHLVRRPPTSGKKRSDWHERKAP